MQLNDYLAALKSGRSLRSRPIPLTFYTHKPDPQPPPPPPASNPSTADSSSTTQPSTPPSDHAEPPPLNCVDLTFTTDFFHVSAFRTPVSSSSPSSPSALSSLALQQIHSNLTSLFTALGIDTPLTLPPDLATSPSSSPSSDPSADDDDDPSFHFASRELTLATFLSSVYPVALHALQSQQVQRSGRVMRSAQLRLQGVRSLFQWLKDADEVGPEVQEATLRRWERLLQKIPRLRVGLTLGEEDAADKEVKAEEERVRKEREESEQRMGIHEEEGGGGARPDASPMSQRAALPFSRLLSQIRRAHGDSEGEEADAEQERARVSNPLLHTTTVFCASSPSSHVDNRGRLVLALRETDSQWHTFLSNPSLFTLANERATAFTQCKTLEQQTAAHLALHDVFADLSLTSTPPYVAYILLLQQSSHIFQPLFTHHPHLRHHLSLRIDSTSPTPSVDPSLGVVRVPLGTEVRALVEYLGREGGRAVQVAQGWVRGREMYEDAMLAVKRRFKVRRLERERGVTEVEMVDCCQRLLSRGGGTASSLRNWLEGMEIGVGREYRFEHGQGKIIIPWDFEL